MAGLTLDRAAPRRPVALSSLLLPLAGAAMAATALLPGEGGRVGALVLIIALGVPHGALDGEVARPVLRPRLGRAWFPLFAVPYLGLAAGVLVAWRLVPEATLAAFLAVSVWHFGTEDAGPGRPWAALVRGGLPVMLPALLHPAATAALFAVVTGLPMPALPVWWTLAAWLWLALAALWLATHRPDRAVLAEIAGLGLAFLGLPPLPAFGLYFVCLHGPRHMHGLMRHPAKAPRVGSLAQAWALSLPVFALTLVLGGGAVAALRDGPDRAGRAACAHAAGTVGPDAAACAARPCRGGGAGPLTPPRWEARVGGANDEGRCSLLRACIYIVAMLMPPIVYLEWSDR